MAPKAAKIGKHSDSSRPPEPSADSSVLDSYTKKAVGNLFLRRPLIKVVRSKLEELGFVSDLQIVVSNDAEVSLRGIEKGDFKKIA